MPFAPSAGMQEVPKKSVGQELGFLAEDDDSGDESDIDRQINRRSPPLLVLCDRASPAP